MKSQQKYTYATEHNDQISDYHRLENNPIFMKFQETQLLSYSFPTQK